jgi:hypothetical protein
MAPEINRRTFLETAAASAAAFTIVPRHVLGGPGYVAPNDKIAIAHIGFGTQSIREVGALLEAPELQIVAVADPEKDGLNYIEWGKGQIRDTIRRYIDNSSWRAGLEHTPGGRDVGKELVETYYAKKRGSESFKGVNTYADFRELLDKEKDIDAVKVMTPDHLHATVAIHAMRKGKHVICAKPIANRLAEARLVIETARQTKVGTHFMPANDGANIRTALDWIKDGTIGTLREIHNWSVRPMWPQYPVIPTDRPPIPKDFDWNLWLGPALDRPYHPHYTHTVFRGWYDFGGGPLCDMGHYSLWNIFRFLDLDPPYCVETNPSHVCMIQDNISITLKNDYSFPVASTIRMRFAAKGDRPALDITWYDGGIKPPVPDEIAADNKELDTEGMLYVGDKGKILAGFRGENPRLIPEAKMAQYRKEKNLPELPPPGSRQGGQMRREQPWIATFKGGPPTYGNFLYGVSISDAFNLASISLRLGGRRLLWDAANMKVTNVPEANKYLAREYRQGWELA